LNNIGKVIKSRKLGLEVYLTRMLEREDNTKMELRETELLSAAPNRVKIQHWMMNFDEQMVCRRRM
jgi:hypothetical protein